MKNHPPRASLIPLLLAAALFVMGAEAALQGYQADIEKWRQERETRLASDTGWLTVAGLFWLKDGPNRFGSDPKNDIVLPASAPASAGVFERHGDQVKVKVESGAAVTWSNQAITEMDMKSDKDGADPTILSLGDLSMFVIARGDKLGIRLKDKNSTMRKEFKGLSWYPVKAEYRITASYQELDPPKQVPIPNILGQVEQLPCPGYVTFKLNGKNIRLDPVLEEPDAKELFFIFRDRTSGETTYHSGRFLYAELPVEGKVILDFNKAYNPPCAFTPYATCPLPPAQNKLDIAIEAGELNYGHH
jgi:uncharacterized protein (DUF1684 family)